MRGKKTKLLRRAFTVLVGRPATSGEFRRMKKNRRLPVNSRLEYEHQLQVDKWYAHMEKGAA